MYQPAEFRCVQWPNCPAARSLDNRSSSKGQSQPSLRLGCSHTPPANYGQHISIALISLLQLAFLSKPNICCAAPAISGTTTNNFAVLVRHWSYWLWGSTFIDLCGWTFWGQLESLDSKYRNHSRIKKTLEGDRCNVTWGNATKNPPREPTRCSENWINSWKCQDCMSQRCARRGVFNLQGDCWCCLWRKGENSCPPPLLIEHLLLTFYPCLQFVWNLGFRTPLKNTQYFISPNFAIFLLVFSCRSSLFISAGAIWKRDSL